MANNKSARVVSPLPVRRALRDIGADVQTWRKLRGLTQAQLGDRAGVARQTVARFERGEGVVSFEIVCRLLNSLGVLGNMTQALDPYHSDVGRLRSDEQLPQRVRPRDLTRGQHG